MEYLQDILDGIGVQISLFFGGLVAGGMVFTSEMMLFVGNLIMAAISNSIPISDAGNSAISYYYIMIFIFAIAGLIQGVLLGLLDKVAFSLGYILGILLMVLLFVNALLNVAPTVVIGMIIALISVVIGLYLKILIQNKREHDYGYY